MSTLVHDEMSRFMSEFRALMVQFDRPKLTPEHLSVLQSKLESLANTAETLCRSVQMLKSNNCERVADALHRFTLLVSQQTSNLQKAGQQKAAELNRLKALLPRDMNTFSRYLEIHHDLRLLHVRFGRSGQPITGAMSFMPAWVSQASLSTNI